MILVIKSALLIFIRLKTSIKGLNFKVSDLEVRKSVL